MAPDLPYVRQDVPDDSEAPQVGGRFARLSRSKELLAGTPASKGITAFLLAWHIADARIARVAVAVAVATALALAALAPMASGDELGTRRAQVKQQIAKTKSDLGESTKALSKAAVAVDKAQHKLDVASAQLATTREELSAAEVQDSRMAVRLRIARADLGSGDRRGKRRTGATGRRANQSRTDDSRPVPAADATYCRSQSSSIRTPQRMCKPACSGQPPCSTPRRPRSTG